MERLEKQEVAPRMLLEKLLKSLLDDKDFGENGQRMLNNSEWKSLKTTKDSISDERPDFMFLVEHENLKSIAGFFSKDSIYPFNETTRALFQKYAQGGKNLLSGEDLDQIRKSVHIAGNYLGEKDRVRGMLLGHLEIGLGSH